MVARKKPAPTAAIADEIDGPSPQPGPQSHPGKLFVFRYFISRKYFTQYTHCAIFISGVKVSHTRSKSAPSARPRDSDSEAGNEVRHLAMLAVTPDLRVNLWPLECRREERQPGRGRGGRRRPRRRPLQQREPGDDQEQQPPPRQLRQRRQRALLRPARGRGLHGHLRDHRPQAAGGGRHDGI